MPGGMICLRGGLAFLYPGPHGRRPSDLARQCNVSRQAMNYLLAALQERGYIERHAGSGGGSRVVRVKQKGRRVSNDIRKCIAEIEEEWAKHLGTERFIALRKTLFELSTWLGKLPV